MALAEALAFSVAGIAQDLLSTLNYFSGLYVILLLSKYQGLGKYLGLTMSDQFSRNI